ncbi:MAG: C4-type zinc ribbon domain-containing protein [Elusimicrobiales bacterium]|jgi:hypothetical protein
MHTTEIRSLIELQARDKVLDELAGRISAVPEEIRALNEAFEEKKSTMNAARETLVKLQVEKKNKELAIAEKDEEVRKHQRDLNAIKDNAAFKALLTEIERAKKDQDEIETEILGLLDAIDKAAAEDRELQRAVKKMEEEKNSRILELEAEKKGHETSLEAARSARADFAGKIGEEVMEKYEFIRSRRKGLAIVRVKEDKTGHISCGGCNMGLTAQKIVDIKTPHALVFCDSCQRMIYMDKTVNGQAVKAEG